MGNGEEQVSEDQWKRSVRFHCRRLVANVLRYQQSVSSDLSETLVEQLVDVASNHAGFANEMYDDPEIVNRAIDYLAHIQDGPWQGVEWFKTSLSVVMELAVPNTGMNEDAAAFLPDLQRGIAQSFQSAPVQRRQLLLSDEDVAHVMTLSEAGTQYGLVSDLFDVCEKMASGEPLGEADQWVLKLASSAAAYTRVARKEN